VRAGLWVGLLIPARTFPSPMRSEIKNCHKTVYHDYATAMRRVKRSAIYKSAYYCARCDGWHLNSVKPDTSETVAEKCKEARGIMRLAQEILK
jgi:hypothetical protein